MYHEIIEVHRKIMDMYRYNYKILWCNNKILWDSAEFRGTTQNFVVQRTKLRYNGQFIFC